MTQPTIRFANHAQAILMECELKGQISDGFWENSGPRDHWRIMCKANITHAHDADTTGAVIGKNFHPKRKYGFDNKGLLDVVGNRMIGFVKFYTTFPNVGYENHWDFDFEHTAQEITDGVRNCLGKSKENPRDKYWVERSERIMNAVGATSIEELEEAMKKVDAVAYDMKMLRKDLREMKEIVNA